MEYPLPERIGDPSLFIGRQKEMALFDRWLNGIPKRLSKSQAIKKKKKSGKTAFIQRLFNQLWSQNGPVIPLYLEITDRKIWLPDFAVSYYRTFASQVISFLERDPAPIRQPLSFESIKAYGESHHISKFVEDVDQIIQDKKQGSNDLVWMTAYEAPHRFAALYDRRV